jgi:L-rhamnose-H+ transport protein
MEMTPTETSPFFGILLHAIGGLAAASFYLPFRKIRSWPWENAWLLGGVFSWILAPSLAAAIWAPESWSVIAASPTGSLFWTWLFGFLWGVGGLTFGLTMRYLGIALGYAVALGMCAAFGTLIPPIFDGSSMEILTSRSGQVTLMGVLVCMLGIAMSGKAGLRKERELSEASKTQTVAEFNFGKGILVALFAGVMSACMAFAFAAGKPIAANSVEAGITPIWQNLPVLIVILFGGFCLNALWCSALIVKKGTLAHYWGKHSGVDEADGTVRPWINLMWCAIAGFTWYLQFFFYGMGATRMGKFEFTSWTLHMSAIIVFSTIWGMLLKEWKGTHRHTHIWIAAGLVVLILSTLLIGWGSSIGNAAGAH